jgi:epoxyqueuosine reductase
LPADKPFAKNGCGPCTACIQECPTQAIVAPGLVDARRCVSYLTIEYKGVIPMEFREAMGNRIYGCDDCQLVCPWNRFTQPNQEPDFKTRHELDKLDLISLFQWSESEWEQKMAGSPIRRIGYAFWLRNIAIALGNSKGGMKTKTVLEAKIGKINTLVDEHIMWALNQLSHPQKENTNQVAQIKPRVVKKYHFPLSVKAIASSKEKSEQT